MALRFLDERPKGGRMGRPIKLPDGTWAVELEVSPFSWIAGFATKEDAVFVLQLAEQIRDRADDLAWLSY